MIRINLFLSAALFFLLQVNASYGQSKVIEDDARMLINLMDYIAKDYQMGVRDGEVINEFEYAEMHEFVATASAKAENLSRSEVVNSSADIQTELSTLRKLIADTASPADVALAADNIKAMMIATNLVKLAPTDWPSMEKGKSLFAEQCASCHGTYGNGDGPAGAGLTPAPTNFRNKDIMSGVAPFQAYNTIRLGIPGTGMRSFTELSDTEIWDLAFYISSLQHLDNRSAKASIEISLVDLASLSDTELKTKYPKANLAGQRSNPIRAKAAQKGPTEIAKSLLQDAATEYSEGNSDAALNNALNAYLQGIEPIEAQVQASDNSLFARLEGDMMAVRSLIERGAEINQLNKAIEKATVTINEAEELISSAERGLFDTALLTIGILLREGLEAFFVILAILGVLKKVNAPSAARWIHIGWITAVVIGLISWFFTNSLVQWSAASRELMEGLIGLFAVAVLLYIGYWLHGKTEASRWKEFVETRIMKLVNNNNMIGLSAFAFIVVFREAFESVLFLSSLSASGTADASLGILIGSLASAIMLFAFGYLMLRLFKKMPIQQVFQFSTIMILTLAIILTGQGVHALQEGGFLPIGSFPFNLRISLLGIYPTIQTMLAQVATLLVIIGLWRLNKMRMQRN